MPLHYCLTPVVKLNSAKGVIVFTIEEKKKQKALAMYRTNFLGYAEIFMHCITFTQSLQPGWNLLRIARELIAI